MQNPRTWDRHFTGRKQNAHLIEVPWCIVNIATPQAASATSEWWIREWVPDHTFSLYRPNKFINSQTKEEKKSPNLVSYDLDDEDVEWLKGLNRSRKIRGNNFNTRGQYDFYQGKMMTDMKNVCRNFEIKPGCIKYILSIGT